jgi:hypothetical protein
VGERAHVHEGLGRVDQDREAGLLHRAVDVLDLDRLAADPLHAVEHDEAGPVRREVGERLTLRLEDEPVRPALDPAR